jgi:FkbM family methyltransferase
MHVMNKDALKQFLHRTNLYPRVRHYYRLLNRSTRRERRVARTFFAQLVDPGNLCFDIGANVGQTTEALTAIGARVVAVEPNPLCRPVLSWQFGRNPNVTVVEKAVGATPGTATLHFEGTASTASLRTDWPFANRSSRTVELTTLDLMIAEFGRPRLCKVDVEGFENEVFKGLSQPIPIVYFELHHNELERAREVLAKLSSVGEIEAVNVTNLENDGWLFERWLGLAELEARLAELPETANAVVRMKAGSRG